MKSLVLFNQFQQKLKLSRIFLIIAHLRLHQGLALKIFLFHKFSFQSTLVLCHILRHILLVNWRGVLVDLKFQRHKSREVNLLQSTWIFLNNDKYILNQNKMIKLLFFLLLKLLLPWKQQWLLLQIMVCKMIVSINCLAHLQQQSTLITNHLSKRLLTPFIPRTLALWFRRIYFIHQSPIQSILDWRMARIQEILSNKQQVVLRESLN